MSLDVYSMNADPVPINEFLAGDDMGGSTEMSPARSHLWRQVTPTRHASQKQANFTCGG